VVIELVTEASSSPKRVLIASQKGHVGRVHRDVPAHDAALAIVVRLVGRGWSRGLEQRLDWHSIPLSPSGTLPRGGGRESVHGRRISATFIFRYGGS
jgi:hypothetical protein